MLSKHPDNCKFPHGHTRKVEFVLEADELDPNDMVCDFKIIKDVMEEFVESFDHALCMNTEDPNYQQMKDAYGDRIIDFEGVDPTTEVMAKAIYDATLAKLNNYAASEHADYPLAKTVRIVKIRLWETSTAWAEYSG